MSAQAVVAMTRNRARLAGGLLAAATFAAAGCGTAVHGLGTSDSPPRGVMSAAQACRRVVDASSAREFLRGVQQVHLVLTTYAKGEPVESEGDISTGMPPTALVWVVDVHARTISFPYSGPPGSRPPAPADSYSVVMNARTGLITDGGDSPNWPLPLWQAGTMISLPPRC